MNSSLCFTQEMYENDFISYEVPLQYIIKTQQEMFVKK